MNRTSIEAAQTAAQSWRSEYECTGRGGVIVIHDGLVQGWVNSLRNPDHWMPGCIAVSEEGQIWIAEGGNDYDGAKAWRAIA